MRWVCALAAGLLLAAPAAVAQTAETVPSVTFVAPPTPEATTTITIPAGTIVQVELAEALSSRTSRTGDTFALRLAEPIDLGGSIVVPAGATGRGEIIDAAPSAMAGRPGKLIVGARTLSVGASEIAIRGMQVGGAGDNLTQEATESMRPQLFPAPQRVGDPTLFTHGGEIDLPVGTRGYARVVADVEIALPVTTPPDPAAANASSATVNAHLESAANADRAEIIFFRPRLSTGSVYTYHVVEAGEDGRASDASERVASLRNNSYIVYRAAPGVHAFNVSGPMVVNRAQDRLRMEVEAGQTYYVVLDFRSGVFTAGFILLPSDVARFMSEGFLSNDN